MPKDATPKLKEFAQRLLTYEAAAGKSSDVGTSAAFRVCEKLRRSLIKFMGAGGFHALFSRALALASKEVPWLRTLQIKADGSLQGVEELDAKLDRKEIASGEIALIAQLLALLVTFIGPELTLRLVQGAWPKAVFDVNFEEGDKS